MKSSRRCLSVCLCLALLLGVFSVPANAVEVETAPYHIYANVDYLGDNGYTYYHDSLMFYPNNGEQEKKESAALFYGQDQDVFGQFNVVYNWNIANDSNTSLANGGKATTFKLENAYHSILVGDQGGALFYHREVDSVYALVTYADNKTEMISNVTCERPGKSTYINLSFTFEPRADVTKVAFFVSAELPYIDEQEFGITAYMGEHNGDNSWVISIDQQSEEAGLLSGILAWVESIWNAITELPQEIWSYIEDGLKNLFVPDEQYMVEYKDSWDELLAEKMGAVYQVVDLTLESWDRIEQADETNTVSMPEVAIPLPDGEEFTFGGYDVEIVPEGFDHLVTAVKLIIGIVCTIAFVNGLRSRYDEVMGVET